MENNAICYKCHQGYTELRESYKDISPLPLCITCRQNADPELRDIVHKFENVVNPLMILLKKKEEKVAYYDRITTTHKAMLKFKKQVDMHQKQNPLCKKNCEHIEELGKAVFPGKTFEEIKDLGLEWMKSIIDEIKRMEHDHDGK